jgi:hypothetical protein
MTCPYFNNCDTECVGNEEEYRFTCSVIIENVKTKTRFKRIREDEKGVVILGVNE